MRVFELLGSPKISPLRCLNRRFFPDFLETRPTDLPRLAFVFLFILFYHFHLLPFAVSGSYCLPTSQQVNLIISSS